MLIRQALPVLPKPDKTLLRQVLDGVMLLNPFQQKAEHFYMQGVVYTHKCIVITVPYS